MGAPMKIIRQADLEKELEHLKESLYALMRSYESVNQAFHQYLKSDKAIEDRYGDFLLARNYEEMQTLSEMGEKNQAERHEISSGLSQEEAARKVLDFYLHLPDGFSHPFEKYRGAGNFLSLAKNDIYSTFEDREASRSLLKDMAMVVEALPEYYDSGRRSTKETLFNEVWDYIRCRFEKEKQKVISEDSKQTPKEMTQIPEEMAQMPMETVQTTKKTENSSQYSGQEAGQSGQLTEMSESERSSEEVRQIPKEVDASQEKTKQISKALEESSEEPEQILGKTQAIKNETELPPEEQEPQQQEELEPQKLEQKEETRKRKAGRTP
ncbi:MAG: hypothetical protein LUI87_17990 [Lachnospiraceae bacterium]|nr:hypothetical protein [Lachnospiraceae bacterium]